MFFGVANIDRQILLNNLLMLAKAVKTFDVPVILTAVGSKEFSGAIIPELQDLFPDETPIERSSMNAWDSPGFIAAVKNTGRRNLVIAALWAPRFRFRLQAAIDIMGFRAGGTDAHDCKMSKE